MTIKYTVKTFLALTCFLHSTLALEARVVVSSEKQTEILRTARAILSGPAASSDLNIDSLRDPFFLQKEKEAVVEEAPVVETARPLNDSEILGLVSEKLRPSGFIEQGGRQYLIINGKKIQDGVSFNFPHQEKLYSILISEIQTHSFTLYLNSESKTISME